MFWNKRKKDSERVDTVNLYQTMEGFSTVNPEEAKDISEPVRAIAKAMKERPKTFSFNLIGEKDVDRGLTVGVATAYLVVDRVTGLKFKYTEERTPIGVFRSIETDFQLTRDEQNLLYYAGEQCYAERRSVIDKRNVRNRQKWVEVYNNASETS